MPPRHFYSNDLTELYRVFKVIPRSFFSRQLVIIPHQNIKHFLMSKFAEEEGVAWGLEFVTASQAVGRLASLCFGIEDLSMSVTALALALEPRIREQEELRFYLRGSFEREGELARYLASLFLYYDSVIEDPFVENPGHWQEKLWIDNSSLLAKILRASPKALDIHIHVFPVHFLSPVQQKLFECLAKHFPVYFYVLSPSKYFWQDLRSKKEQAYVQHGELREYLKAGNTLLASYSKQARSTHMYLEEVSHCDGESYLLPDSAKQWEYTQEHIYDPSLCFEENKPATLLRALQVDLLFQRNTVEEKAPQLGECNSLQIHSHINKRREVEGAYYCVLEFLRSTKFTPKDIRILAPKIADYEPYIRSVFAVPHRILDVPEVGLEGFLDFIRLVLYPDEIKHFFRLINRKQNAFSFVEELRPLLSQVAHGNPDFALFCQRLYKSKMFYEEHVWVKNLLIIQRFQTQKIPLDAWRLQLLEISMLFFPDEAERVQAHIQTFFSFSLGGDLLFSSWGCHLEAYFNSLQTNDPCRNIESIRCANISSLSEIPSALTIVLGLSEEAFPRPPPFPTLNLIENKAPKNAHTDRWYFLQVLLSTKERLILSCPRNGASLILTELLEYLEDALAAPLTIHHPPFCSTAEHAASLKEAAIQTAYTDKEFNIYNLVEVSKNPLKPYFKHQLGIAFEDVPQHLFPKPNLLTLSHLDTAILRRRCMKQDLNEILPQTQSSFHEGSFMRISLEVKERELWLEENKIRKQDIVRIKLSKECAAISESANGYWEYPPFQFNEFTIEGFLPYFCSQGVLCDAKEEFSTFLQLWPQLVILHRIYEVPQKVFFLRSQSIRSYHIESDLMPWIHFTEQCYTEAMVLDPEWIPALLENDIAALKKGIKQTLSSFNPVENPYLFSEPLPSAEELLKQLRDPVNKAFSGAYRAYHERI